MDTSFLRDYAETWGFSAGQPTGVKVTPDGDAVIFLRSGPRDLVRNLYEMNTTNGIVRGLLRAPDLLAGEEESLSDEEKARRERMREIGHGLVWYQLSEDGEKILTSLSGRLYVVRRSDGKVTPLRESPAGPAIDAKFSPDGRFVSCVRGHDVYVTDLETLYERAVTAGGTPDVSHGIAEFVAQEEMDRHTGYWWSGDGQYLAFEEVDQREVETLYIADARSPERPPSGRRYPRAGKTNATTRLGIVSVTGGEPKWALWDRQRYPYIAAVHWGKESPLTMYVQSRDQRAAALFLVDIATGLTIELLKEADPAWINIDPDMPRWLARGREFLWTSERSGQWELELRDLDGSLKRTYRPGDAALYGVVHVAREERQVIVSGSSNAAQTHLYRISLDSGEIAALSDGVSVNSGVFSKDGTIWARTRSTPDGAVRQAVCGPDGRERFAIPSVAEEPPFAANLELTTVRVGDRTHHAAIVRPRNFVKGRKYPVIDYVYGGPGHPVVSASGKAYLRQQWIADQGFIVVSIDGRGTPRRGRDWERAIKGDLIDAPLADQAAALKALGAKHGELDLSRVGIYGWSFGGYFAAMAACRMPEVFHAAVAGAPVIDWADYDTHYTERYMGMPDENAEGYRAANVLTYADRLSRPLMLIHGATDDNVYFAHTIRMSEALFRAGKDFDLVVLPGFTHMVPEPLVTMRLYERIARFFLRNLVESRPAAR